MIVNTIFVIKQYGYIIGLQSGNINVLLLLFENFNDYVNNILIYFHLLTFTFYH